MGHTWQVSSTAGRASTAMWSVSDRSKLELFSSAVTCSEFIDLYSERSLAFSHSKNLIPSLVTASRPKWQYAAVSWYLGSRSASDIAMAPGRQSKAILITLVMSSAESAPCSVPYVSTKSDRGFATPIAYESCTRARLQRPLFTADFAICRQM